MLHDHFGPRSIPHIFQISFVEHGFNPQKSAAPRSSPLKHSLAAKCALHMADLSRKLHSLRFDRLSDTHYELRKPYVIAYSLVNIEIEKPCISCN